MPDLQNTILLVSKQIKKISLQKCQTVKKKISI